MEKISASSIDGIILLENKPTSSSQFLGIILLYIVLHWLITLQNFYSRICCTLQTILHFLFRVGVEGENTSTGVSTPSSLNSAHVNVDSNNKLFRGEVEAVMEKLGIFCDPKGDKFEERVGLKEIEALFEEEMSLEDAREAFGVFDENCDGYIDRYELEKVLCTLGFKEVSELDCQKMIRVFDDNGDGLIDFSEFSKLLENSSC